MNFFQKKKHRIDAKAPEGWKSFIEQNPWPDTWLQYGKPVEYFFEMRIFSSLANLWSALSDTSRINKMLGLPEMKFFEKDGKKFGTYKLIGIRHTWYEVPWEWLYGHFISAERIYSEGLLHFVRARFEIQPLPDLSYRVRIYFGWVPKNRSSHLFFQSYRKKFILQFSKTLQRFTSQQSAQKSVSISVVPPVDPLSPPYSTIQKSQINIILKKAKTYPYVTAELLHRCLNFLFNAPPEKVGRIRPKIIARELGVTLYDILPVLLFLTREGTLLLSWEVLCPNCQGVKEQHQHLWDSPHGSKCDKCEIDFSKVGYNMLEISFYPHPHFRKIEQQMFCSAEPAQKPQILMQIKVAAQQRYHFTAPFPPGRYRLLRIDRLGFNYLDILEDLDSTSLSWSSEDLNENFSLGPRSTIHLVNNRDLPSYFVIQELGIDNDVLRPHELFNFQIFRDLFPDEKLADGLSINVGIQNLLFVDIVGSSRIYKEEGDNRAFSIVRSFYKEVHQIAQSHQGAIVKTIGDAVLASFSDALSALKAAMAISGLFNGQKEETPITTRITLNRGHCLAVNMDSTIDYFGSTVNIVAKLQSEVSAHEIAFTHDFLEDVKVNAYMSKKGFSFHNQKKANIKGLGEILYYKIKIAQKNKSL